MSERSRARHKERHLKRLSNLAGRFYDDAAARDDGKNDARKVAAVPGAREIGKACPDKPDERRPIYLFDLSRLTPDEFLSGKTLPERLKPRSFF